MIMWRRGVVVIAVLGIISAQHSPTQLELRLSTSSNPARGVSEIRDSEDI